MNKLMMMVTLAAAAVWCTGCATVSKKTEAKLVGNGIYLAATKVEEKVNKPEFHEKVTNLWAKIDAIDSVEEIGTTWSEVAAAFDEVIDSKDITKGQKTILKSFRKILDAQVVAVLNATFTSNTEALEYLKNVREGIRAMIKAESGVEVECEECSDCKDCCTAS